MNINYFKFVFMLELIKYLRQVLVKKMCSIKEINMNNIKRLVVLFIFLSCILLFNGCIKNEYKEFTEKFNNTYLEIVKAVDITDTIKTLKNIQSEENKNRIDELKSLLENIQSKVPSGKEDEYKQYINWYKGLVILKETPYHEWDNLSFKQKSNIWIEIDLIDIRRE